ncbi:hypothetical protein PHET_10907, partial [Paragonimus heterotremus]
MRPGRYTWPVCRLAQYANGPWSAASVCRSYPFGLHSSLRIVAIRPPARSTIKRRIVTRQGDKVSILTVLASFVLRVCRRPSPEVPGFQGRHDVCRTKKIFTNPDVAVNVVVGCLSGSLTPSDSKLLVQNAMSLIKHCPLPSSSTTHKCHMEQLSSARSPPSADRDSNDSINLHSTFLDEADDPHAYFVRMDTDSGLSDNLVNTSNADDSGAGALLDDALSAAMEAIAEANRLNEGAESENGLGSVDTHTHHHLPMVSLNSSFGSTDKLDPDMEIQAHSPSGDMFSNGALVFDYDKVP